MTSNQERIEHLRKRNQELSGALALAVRLLYESSNRRFALRESNGLLCAKYRELQSFFSDAKKKWAKDKRTIIHEHLSQHDEEYDQRSSQK